MNKQILAIIAAIIIVILAIAAGIFIINRNTNESNEDINNSTLDNPIDTKDLEEYTSMPQDKLDEIMDKPLTDEQQALIEKVEEETFIPDVSSGTEALPDDDPTDNVYQVEDTNGDIWEVTVPEDDLSDEELQRYLDQTKADLQQSIDNLQPGLSEIARDPDIQVEDGGANYEEEPTTDDIETSPNYDPDSPFANIQRPNEGLTEEEKQQRLEDATKNLQNPIGTIHG